MKPPDKLPDIAFCWDGRTPTAELIIDGMTTSGKPDDVHAVFALLNALRDRAQSLEKRLTSVKDALAKADEAARR